MPETAGWGRLPVPRSQQAWEGDALALSAISFWEIAMLRDKVRIWSPDDVELWRREQLGHGMVEIPVDGEARIRAATIVDFHADPADCIIVATALGGHRLATADERILAWGGDLDRLDARA